MGLRSRAIVYDHRIRAAAGADSKNRICGFMLVSKNQKPTK